jgi:geranylgeranyl diphosphate synthase type I
MVLPSVIQSALQRHQREIDRALRDAIAGAAKCSGVNDTAPYYGQMQYHLGWVDASFAPVSGRAGKRLRPTLLLLAYEAAGAWGLADEPPHGSSYLERALPAAAAIELTHNFTLIHDDIADGDAVRHHQATLWKLWGIPQAINTGDGMFVLARLTLWGVLDKGVEPAIAARLGAILDRACLVIADGQYLDISFEQRQDISVAMYLDMIGRKTAALMSSATEMGALLGTRDEETIKRLRDFGYAVGIAFQVRDDLLGIWATTAELGKTPAGDIYRRKKSLPILHALEHADPHDWQELHEIYQQEAPIQPEQVKTVLAIMERTQSKTYCRNFLAQECQQAYTALESVPHNSSHVSARALDDMKSLVHFVAEEIL